MSWVLYDVLVQSADERVAVDAECCGVAVVEVACSPASVCAVRVRILLGPKRVLTLYMYPNLPKLCHIELCQRSFILPFLFSFPGKKGLLGFPGKLNLMVRGFCCFCWRNHQPAISQFHIYFTRTPTGTCTLHTSVHGRICREFDRETQRPQHLNRQRERTPPAKCASTNQPDRTSTK
jgi:hypothetical protein